MGKENNIGSQVKALTEGLKNIDGVWKNTDGKRIDKERPENIEKKNSARIDDLSKFLDRTETVVGFFGIGEDDKEKQSIVLYNNIKGKPEK